MKIFPNPGKLQHLSNAARCNFFATAVRCSTDFNWKLLTVMIKLAIVQSDSCQSAVVLGAGGEVVFFPKHRPNAPTREKVHT